jgi:hypothetical protein
MVASKLADSVLSIWELLIVLEKIFGSITPYPVGQPIDSKSPERDVDIVDPVVADIATSKVVPPSPDTM